MVILRIFSDASQSLTPEGHMQEEVFACRNAFITYIFNVYVLDSEPSSTSKNVSTFVKYVYNSTHFHLIKLHDRIKLILRWLLRMPFD